MTSKNTSATDADGIDSQSISVRDGWGAEHVGVIARVQRFEGDIRKSLTSAGHDFLIVLLADATCDQPSADPTTVFCTPGASAFMISEQYAAYTAGPTDVPSWLSPQELRLYRDGTFVASANLQITPAEVFARSSAGFEALASELVRRLEADRLLASVARAVSAPIEPRRRNPAGVLADVRRLLRDAKRSIATLPDDVRDQLEVRLARLQSFASSRKPDTASAAATSVYHNLESLVDDIFLLRALIAYPDEAINVLRMQAFVEMAAVPHEADGDLAVDRASVEERLRFATLVSDPGQLPGMSVSFKQFQKRYLTRYADHHARYWTKAAKVQQSLANVRSQAEALHRLNSISELGPALEMEALVAYGDLLHAPSPCTVDGIDIGAPTCANCRVTLADTPDARTPDVFESIERGLDAQRKRLASAAVNQVLRQSSDPRIDRFLKVVQATQISSLIDVLDDDLTGYLRRFLVEARLGVILEPLLTHVAQGNPPDDAQANTALRDLANVIEQAFDNNRIPPAPQLPPAD